MQGRSTRIPRWILVGFPLLLILSTTVPGLAQERPGTLRGHPGPVRHDRRSIELRRGVRSTVPGFAIRLRYALGGPHALGSRSRARRSGPMQRDRADRSRRPSPRAQARQHHARVPALLQPWTGPLAVYGGGARALPPLRERAPVWRPASRWPRSWCSAVAPRSSRFGRLRRLSVRANALFGDEGVPLSDPRGGHRFPSLPDQVGCIDGVGAAVAPQQLRTRGAWWTGNATGW